MSVLLYRSIAEEQVMWLQAMLVVMHFPLLSLCYQRVNDDDDDFSVNREPAELSFLENKHAAIWHPFSAQTLVLSYWQSVRSCCQTFYCRSPRLPCRWCSYMERFIIGRYPPHRCCSHLSSHWKCTYFVTRIRDYHTKCFSTTFTVWSL